MVQAGTGSATDPVVLPTLSGSVQTTVSFGTVAGGSVVAEDLYGVQWRRRGVEPVRPVGAGGLHGGLRRLLHDDGDGAARQFHEFVLQENTSAVGTFGGTVTFTTNDSAAEASVQLPGDGDGERRGADGHDFQQRAGRPGKPGDGQSWQPPRSGERGHGPVTVSRPPRRGYPELRDGGYGLFGPVHLRRRRHVHGVGPDHRPERIVYGLLHAGDGRQPADVDHRRRGSRSRFYDDGNVDELYRSGL